jgi:outer membrane autotransporter protein
MFGEAAYGFAVGKLAIEPFAGGAFTSVNVNGAREQGGAAALTLAGTRFDVTTSNIGLRFGSVLPTAEGMVLSPRASLSWQHAFGGLTPLDIFAFQSAPAATFAVAGTPIARDALLTEAGVDLALSPQATIGIAYSGKWAPNAQDHSARGRFSWRF